jgi:hypothetical protein
MTHRSPYPFTYCSAPFSLSTWKGLTSAGVSMPIRSRQPVSVFMRDDTVSIIRAHHPDPLAAQLRAQRLKGGPSSPDERSNGYALELR